MMPVSFKSVGSDLVCEGNDITYLRLKTKLACKVGSGQIRTINQTMFALPIAAAAISAQVFKEVCGDVPEMLGSQILSLQAHTRARVEAKRIASENDISPLAPPWPDVLDRFQAVAVSAMVVPGLLGLCLFDEQGTGKTVMAIAAFDILRQRGEVDRLIVVCPKTMVSVWPGDIEKFVPRKYNVVVATGSTAEKSRLLLSPFDILICNYEAVDSLLVRLKAISENNNTLLVADESFNVKNRDAIRSGAVRHLRKSCVRGFVLCGTPAPNSPIDVIHQFDVADGGCTFVGLDKIAMDNDPAGRIAEQIEKRGVYIRRLKEEVLPMLPKKRFHILRVKMAGRQAMLYEEARSNLELKLRSMDNATFRKSLATYFQLRSALLQICACPKAVDPSFCDVSAKMVILDKLVQKIVDRKRKKIIIWSFYREGIASAYERYKAYSPILLDGDTEAQQRALAVRQFQTDPDARICIANPAAAGAGITLHSAADAVYLSFSNQAAHFLQSIDRIHRRGQKAHETNYHLLVCRGSIEESEVRRLRSKEVNQHRLFNDTVKWPNSLDDALSELAQAND